MESTALSFERERKLCGLKNWRQICLSGLFDVYLKKGFDAPDSLFSKTFIALYGSDGKNKGASKPKPPKRRAGKLGKAKDQDILVSAFP